MSNTKQMLAGIGIGTLVLGIAGYLAYSQFYMDMSVAAGGGYSESPAGIVGGPGVAAKGNAEAEETAAEGNRPTIGDGNTAAATKTSTEQPAQGISAQISISGVRNGKGKVYVMVFDNASAFNNYNVNSAIGFAELKARKGKLTTTITDLPNAPIAVSIFHDENGNENFDMAGGYPSEGYGTSRAGSPYDELKFHQASVKPGNVGVKMHYLK